MHPDSRLEKSEPKLMASPRRIQLVGEA
jgi:hypothetical protein